MKSYMESLNIDHDTHAGMHKRVCAHMSHTFICIKICDWSSPVDICTIVAKLVFIYAQRPNPANKCTRSQRQPVKLIWATSNCICGTTMTTCFAMSLKKKGAYASYATYMNMRGGRGFVARRSQCNVLHQQLLLALSLISTYC